MNNDNLAALAELLNRRFRAGTQLPHLVADWLIREGAVFVPATLTQRDADFLVLGIDHGRNMLPEGPEVGKAIRDVSRPPKTHRGRRCAIGPAVARRRDYDGNDRLRRGDPESVGEWERTENCIFGHGRAR